MFTSTINLKNFGGVCDPCYGIGEARKAQVLVEFTITWKIYDHENP